MMFAQSGTQFVDFCPNNSTFPYYQVEDLKSRASCGLRGLCVKLDTQKCELFNFLKLENNTGFGRNHSRSAVISLGGEAAQRIWINLSKFQPRSVSFRPFCNNECKDRFLPPEFALGSPQRNGLFHSHRCTKGDGARDEGGAEREPTFKRQAMNDGGRLVAGKNMETRLLQRLGRTLADRHLLRPGQKVLLAVSGGQDSACLLHLLVKLQPEWEWKIGVAHCDHRWSSTSRQQASHVAQMAKSLGLDYYQALTVKPAPGREGVARTWRYGVLQRIASAHGFEAIVTAHTASDRVETLLFNVFRGSGLQGSQSLPWKRSLSAALAFAHQSAFQASDDPVVALQGPEDGGPDSLPPPSPISLVRPLLDFTRTELRELREGLGLPLWPDLSNHDLDIDRNRVRHELLPYLRKHFNPAVDKSLARWAEILHGEQLYLDDLCDTIRATAESEFEEEAEGKCRGGRKLDASLVRSLSIALQRRILKKFADGYTGKNLGFDTVESARLACARMSSVKSGWNVSLPGQFQLRICRDYLIVTRQSFKETRK